ncbi:hypothetical protein RIF29_17987 [Crotalaria pallida]|uniref:Uncharacterized protein n=1 Tax=Crotalaria pallida TaxID=3830 RepID=A0AAN9FLF1_CROPI
MQVGPRVYKSRFVKRIMRCGGTWTYLRSQRERATSNSNSNSIIVIAMVSSSLFPLTTKLLFSIQLNFGFLV